MVTKFFIIKTPKHRVNKDNTGRHREMHNGKPRFLPFSKFCR